MTREARVERATAETTIRVEPRPRRDRHRADRDRHRLLRPHARPAGAALAASTSRWRRAATSSSTSTTPWRTPGSSSAARWTRRSASGPPSAATAMRGSRWTRPSRRAPRPRRPRLLGDHAPARPAGGRQPVARAAAALPRVGGARGSDDPPPRRGRRRQRPSPRRGGDEGASPGHCAAATELDPRLASTEVPSTKGTHRLIAVVDFGSGNTRSVLRALARVGSRCGPRQQPARGRGRGATRLPRGRRGRVGGQALRTSGLWAAVAEAARAGTPLLGICLGAQLLLDSSDEDEAPGLGLIPGRCRAFPSPGGRRAADRAARRLERGGARRAADAPTPTSSTATGSSRPIRRSSAARPRWMASAFRASCDPAR